MTVFYILSLVAILSSVLLITNQNPVYSVLSLVLIFVTGSIILLMLGVDFLPFVFVVVYVGAVAVLFLFVVIMLDIKLISKSSSFKEIPLVFIIGTGVFLFLNILTKPYLDSYALSVAEDGFSSVSSYQIIDDTSSLSSLGQLLYTQYILHFVIGGLVLLVAIIGAIVLTSRIKTNSLKQKVFKQTERYPFVGKHFIKK